MKKQLLILLLLGILGVPTAYSQTYQYVPMPDSGAVWSEAWWNGDTIIFERFAVNGEDTLIDGIKYNKLYLFYNSVFAKETAIAIGGMREDSLKRIYYRGKSIHEFKPGYNSESEEILLYDFSAEVGDTVINGNARSLVNDIDTIQIGDTYRRRFDLSYLAANGNPYWIEGIGSTRGLLYPSSGSVVGWISQLICFSQNNVVLYSDENSMGEYKTCYPSNLRIHEISAINYPVKVYPNPMENGQVTFDLQNITCESVKIFDAKGVLMNCILPKGQQQLPVSLTKYPKGIYFYVITAKDGMQYTGKLEMF